MHLATFPRSALHLFFGAPGLTQLPAHLPTWRSLPDTHGDLPGADFSHYLFTRCLTTEMGSSPPSCQGYRSWAGKNRRDAGEKVEQLRRLAVYTKAQERPKAPGKPENEKSRGCHLTHNG